MRVVFFQRAFAIAMARRLRSIGRMIFRPASIVDSLLELRENSREPDAMRLRRAHLARYTKGVIAGAIAVCAIAAVRGAVARSSVAFVACALALISFTDNARARRRARSRARPAS
jgi:hypothetical protein